MKKDREDRGAYVRKVRENTQRYVQELLGENEKLRVLAGSLENQNLRLQEQILRIREELENHDREQVSLQRRLAEIGAENRRFSEQYIQVEQQNSNLANLYVASYSLHSTLNREQALATIQEIIINMIGSEEMAIFELNPDASELTLVASFGIERGSYVTVPVGSGIIGRVALTGERYLAEAKEGNGLQSVPDGLSACIPMELDGKVFGAIAVFRLLQQKAGFEALDTELFELLGTHAAMALYCTGLHARTRGKVGRLA